MQVMTVTSSASRPRSQPPARATDTDPARVLEQVRALVDDDLHNLAEVVRQVQIERAIGNGDHDAIIAAAFEVGFGRDGLGVLPWIEGNVVVCPGGLVSKSKTSHRCRFVSVDDVWVWDSGLLLREDKRSAPGVEEGFRAIALIPLVHAGDEPGKEILHPVAVVIVGGLVSSTLLDFLVTPALFHRFGRRAAERALERNAAAAQ